MPMIQCHECGKDISDSAEHCPHCGCKTSHGKRLVESKCLLYKMLVAGIALFLGAFFAFNAWTQLMGHGSYYWEYHDEEQFKLILKLAFGVGLLLGGIITMVQVKNGAKELQYSEQISKPTQIKDPPPAFIPEDKRKYGPCAKCENQGIVAECRLPNQFGDFDLCPKCINRYRGQLR